MNALLQVYQDKLLKLSADMRAVQAEKANDPTALLESLGKIEAEFKATREAMDTIKRTDALLAATEAPQASLGMPFKGDAADKEAKETQAFMACLRGNATPEQRALLQVSAAQSTGTGSAGGFLVPQRLSNRLVEAMKAYGDLYSLATIYPSPEPNTVLIPSVDNTSRKAAIIGENSADTAVDMTFSQTSIAMYQYRSTWLASNRFLLADATNVEGSMIRFFGTAFGRALNEHITVGTGSSQPHGVVGSAATGVTAGSATAVTADNITSLIYSVDGAYRNAPGAGLMMNSQTQLALLLLKDTTGQYLWRPAVAAGQPNTFNGFPVYINEDMANIGASAAPVLFGDFSNYHITTYGTMRLEVARELHLANDQTGYYGFAYYGGRLVNAGTNPVKKLVMAAS